MVKQADIDAIQDVLEILVMAVGFGAMGVPPQAAIPAQRVYDIVPGETPILKQTNLSNELLMRAMQASNMGVIPGSRRRRAPARKKKVSAYHRKYGREFKKLAPKYKKKNGSWKKDGFKRCAAAARRRCK